MSLKNSKTFTSLAASDLDRAKGFYTEILGLEVQMEMEGAVALTTGVGSSILIYEREASKAEHTVLGFEVADFAGTAAALQAANVSFEVYAGLTDAKGIADMGGIKSAWFTDTEGNIIALTEIYTG